MDNLSALLPLKNRLSTPLQPCRSLYHITNFSRQQANIFHIFIQSIDRKYDARRGRSHYYITNCQPTPNTEQGCHVPLENSVRISVPEEDVNLVSAYFTIWHSTNLQIIFTEDGVPTYTNIQVENTCFEVFFY